jgi:hypothetical protein
MIYAGCQPAANTTAPNATVNAAANAAKPAGAAPTADALMAMENKAWEAWKNKDAKYFEEFTADPFVGFNDRGERATRAETIKMITEDKCEVKSMTLSDPKLTMAGADAAVLTYKAAQDATCEGHKLPATVTAATVFVRKGDGWKAAYHNEVAVVASMKDIKPPASAPAKKDDDMKADDKKGEEKKGDDMKAASNANSSPAGTASSDALTTEIAAVEKAGWEAWKAKDKAKLEETTHKDLTFVNIMGMVTSPQSAVVKMWVEEKCEVKAVDVTDAHATSLDANTAILTYKGHAEGTCDGQPLGDLWGTTVAIKDGGKWRAVYIFETPMM